jgi:putative ABC transport system permease protein
MLKNYLKISWRNLLRNKTYTAINVAGLALSMTCGILIFILVSFNLSFDKFHKNGDRIYRLVTEAHRDNISYVSSVPPALGSAIRRDYTFAEAVARIVNLGDQTITVGQGAQAKPFKEADGINFAEASYFNIFNFPLVAGSVSPEKNTVVLTERVAKKYFGNENPIGKTLNLDRGVLLTVTGILKDLPPNTDQKGEVFAAYQTLEATNDFFVKDDSWGGIGSAMQCFVRLKPGVNLSQIEAEMDAYVPKFRPKSKNVHHYKLQPLAEVHFDGRYGGAMEKKTLWVLSLIGAFILITACVNFINLATAQALKRGKEVGVRKVLGSRPAQLFWQFILETTLIVMVGMGLAIVLAFILLPYENTLFKSDMSMASVNVGFLAALGVTVILLAGAYPGLIMAGFRPTAALKGKITQQQIGGFNMRRGLIITQFAISQVLITGMLVIALQMRYTNGGELGFNKDAVLIVAMGLDSTGSPIKAFKNSLAVMPGVEKVTACYTAPSARGGWSTNVRFDNHAEDEAFLISVKSADDQYLSAFGLEVLAGRNLYPSDTLKEFLVNETFVRKLNITNDNQILGKRLSINGGHMTAPIVGVIRDFHDESFHSDINPVCIGSGWGQYSEYAVKIDMRKASTVIPAIGKVWDNLYPGQIFDYQFLDDQIASFYRTETTMLRLAQVFTLIALGIGCMGLYGLVMFMAAQKTKEVGIRKVLGSTVGQIVWLFGREYARLIVIAFVLSVPVTWWLMSRWLQDFKYHITLGPLYFAATLVLIFAIAFVTVGYQSVKAALVNPVKSLRSE